MAASPPDGRRSLHLQPREAGTELPRDAIVLRWEALRELGLALGDKVQVRCTGEAHTETWAMLAWASGRIPAGCVLVPPALGLLSCTGCVELWPAGLTLEGSPLPCTSTSLPIANRSPHSLSAGVHKARRLCGATSNADVGVTTAGPLPLVLLLAGDLGAAVGPELETLAQVRLVGPRPHTLHTAPASLPCPACGVGAPDLLTARTTACHLAVAHARRSATTVTRRFRLVGTARTAGHFTSWTGRFR